MNATTKSLLTTTALLSTGILTAWGDNAPAKTALPEIATHNAGQAVAATATKNEIGALLDDIPLLRKNLRPFQTLSLKVTEEKIDDAGKWKHVATRQIRMDLKKNFIKIKSAEDSGTDIFLSEMSILDGKITGTACYVRKNEPNILEPKEKESPYGYTKIMEPLDVYLHSKLSSYWLHYVKHPGRWEAPNTYIATPGNWIIDLFENPDFYKSAVLVQQPNPEEIHIRIPRWKRFIFSKRSGMITKVVYEDKTESGDFKESGFLEATRFTQKSGWLFPTTIVIGREGKAVSRQTIDPDSVEIDKPLLISDFSVTIPKGYEVRDGLKKSIYKAPRDITSMDPADTEAQLKELIEKAKKDAKKAND